MESDTSTRELVDRLCNAIDSIVIAIEDASLLVAARLKAIDAAIGYIQLECDK